MKPSFKLAAALLLLSSINFQPTTALAQSTAFTYQGRLNNGTNAANGLYDFQFSLSNAPSGGGSQVGSTVTEPAIVVTNGLFTTTLNFGAVFTGNPTWLAISVRTNGVGGYVGLNPLQQLTPTPYAIYAEGAANLNGTLPAGQLTSIGNGNFFAGTAGNGATTGAYNTAYGNSALSDNTSGANNTANGYAALFSNLGGSGNTATGFEALLNNTSGSNNTADGFEALYYNRIGKQNTAIGDYALFALGNTGALGGSNNIALGDQAGYNLGGNESSNIDIGNPGLAGENNTIRIGATQSQTFIAGLIHGNGGGLTNLSAAQLTGTLGLAQLPVAVVTNNATGLTLAGTFSGNGANVTGVNAATLGSLAASAFWKTSGNAGTVPGVNFLGTTDDQPLELWVNGSRALRLEPNAIAPNVIGGGSVNLVDVGIVGSVIAGGGTTLYEGQFSTNRISANFSSIGGGAGNWVQLADESVIAGGGGNTVGTNSFFSVISGGHGNQTSYAPYSTIGGGNNNTVQDEGWYSTIDGGTFNIIETNALGATIGGGAANKIETSASSSTIGGGSQNTIQSDTLGGNGNFSTIGGGENNAIQTNAFLSSISGGSSNTIQINANESTINGGLGNTIKVGANDSSIGGGQFNTNSGPYATVPGGFQNVAGANSLAAGHRAKAINNGTFVWADSTEADFTSTGDNQFLIRAQGGVGIGTANPLAALQVDSASGNAVVGNATSGNAVVGNATTGYAVYGQITGSGGWAGLFRYGTDGNNSAYFGRSGDAAEFDGTVTVNGTFNNNSDRTVKEHFASVSPDAILDKVARLPITTWNYKKDSLTTHIGPMAQDFYAIFSVGTDERHIAPIDEGGVALAAIQGLNQKLNEKDAEIQDLKQNLTELKKLVQSLAKSK